MQTEYMPIDEAAKAYRQKLDTLHKWTRRPIAALGGRPLAWEKRLRPNANGHLRHQVCVSRPDMEVIRDHIVAVPGQLERGGKNYLSQSAAAKYLRVPEPTIREWVNVSCHYLGRRLTTIHQPMVRNGLKGRVPEVYVSQNDLDAVREAKRTHEITVEGVRYLLLPEAAKKYGEPIWTLRSWAERGCCWLGGAKLRRHSLGMRGRLSSVHLAVPDLDVIKANRREAKRLRWHRGPLPAELTLVKPAAIAAPSKPPAAKRGRGRPKGTTKGATTKAAKLGAKMLADLEHDPPLYKSIAAMARAMHIPEDTARQQVRRARQERKKA